MILAKLKEATREQHEGLENTVDVMDQMFTLENYKTLLTKFYRFYSSIEPQIDKLDLSGTGYNFDERRKLPKLEADLKHLGVFEKAEQMPKWDGVPPLENSAQAMGSLYVMEGATLGGQIINRHLKEHLGISPENGGAFFNGYGAETGPKWKEFMAIANTFAEDGTQDEVIIDSAKQTFDSFKNCFTETEV
jgi:heme oxygenase